jgi:hypothetical protein
MKNKILVLVIYIENKRSTEYVQRWERKLKSVIKIYQNYSDRFIYK